MEWTITVKEGRYVEIVTHGIADGGGSLEMARAITMTMREQKRENLEAGGPPVSLDLPAHSLSITRSIP